MNSICAGILAGGQSQRFGTDKAFAILHGKPLIQHLIDSLRPQVQAMVISVRSDSTLYRELGLPLVCDQVGAGPLAGVAALLAACEQEWLLTVPCDALEVPVTWARQLLGVARERRARLIVRADHERIHPCFALLHRSLKDSIQAAVCSGEQALYRWQNSVADRVTYITSAPININTSAALAALSVVRSHSD